MTSFDWPTFLNKWSEAILASPDVTYFALPAEAIESGWLGFDGASEEQIATAEARLGVSLPPSYRAFLKASNGWRHTGTFIDRILPVEEIYWLRDTDDETLIEHANLYISQMAGLPFDPDQGEVDYDHFMDTLVIAEPTQEQELYLLNPRVKDESGEWQAWAFAHWIPGAENDASFQALIEGEYQAVLNANKQEAQRFDPDDDQRDITEKLSALIAKLHEDANFFDPPGSEARADHPLYRHNMAMATGIREVAKELKALDQETLDPAELLLRLKAVADEYQRRHDAARPDISRLQAEMATITGPDDPRLAELTSRIIAGSLSGLQTHGYIHAVQIIRFFLR